MSSGRVKAINRESGSLLVEFLVCIHISLMLLALMAPVVVTGNNFLFTAFRQSQLQHQNLKLREFFKKTIGSTEKVSGLNQIFVTENHHLLWLETDSNVHFTRQSGNSCLQASSTPAKIKGFLLISANGSRVIRFNKKKHSSCLDTIEDVVDFPGSKQQVSQQFRDIYLKEKPLAAIGINNMLKIYQTEDKLLKQKSLLTGNTQTIVDSLESFSFKNSKSEGLEVFWNFDGGSPQSMKLTTAKPQGSILGWLQ